MQVIKGIQAFEACWNALKQTYPTSKADNTLLVQSMGRYVDAYGTQAEIRSSLPQPLHALFDRLIDAYVNGYVPNSPQTDALPQSVTMPEAANDAVPAPKRVTATTLAMSELRRQLPELAMASEAETFVVDASA
ncbi:MAG: hypothetical protein AAFQ61_07620 [Cyanobacteria bacterium J06626_23]